MSRRVPGWARLGVAAAVALVGWFGWQHLGTPPAVREAIAQLRTTSVTVAGGAPTDVLDPDRVAEVIGDRPVVVAVLPDDLDAGDACDAITDDLDDVLAAVYVGGGGPYTCLGGDFPAADPELANSAFTAHEAWLFQLSLDAGASSRFRLVPGDPDRTAEVEELVLAFDARVTQGLTDGVERRELAASPSVLGRTAALLAGLVAGTFLLLGLLQLAVTRTRARIATRRARRTTRLALTTDLAAVADVVLRAEPLRVLAGGEGALARARARADVAGRYVLTLTQVEAARTDPELAAAHDVVAVLRADADRLLPEPEQAPAPVGTRGVPRGRRGRSRT